MYSPTLQVLFLTVLFRRYPEYMRPAMCLGLVLYFVCLFCSSFATEVCACTSSIYPTLTSFHHCF